MNSEADEPVVAESPAEITEIQVAPKPAKAKRQRRGPFDLPAETSTELGCLMEQLGIAGEALTDAVQGWNNLVEQIETLPSDLENLPDVPYV